MISTRSFALLVMAFLVCHAPLGADTPRLRLDAHGDPLPAQATHRFGTARFCTEVEVNSLALSADGKLLAAADREGRCYVWDAVTGIEKLRTATGAGKRVVLAPNGRWLAMGDEFPFEVRDLVRDGPSRLQLGAGTRAFVFSPDSKSLAASNPDDTDVVVYDVESGKELRRFAGVEGTITALAFSPDGKRLAAAAPRAESEKPAVQLVVWDAASAEKQKEWDFAAAPVQKLVFLPDNKTLITHFASRLAGWNVLTGDRLTKLNRSVGPSFGLDNAGVRLATTDGPKVSEFATGKVLHEFETASLLRHLALSGDGKLLAAASSRFELATPRILLWDLVTGKERTITDAHRHYVDAVAFSHDGRLIATASNVEGAARIWDARTTKLLFTLNLDSLAAKQSGGPRSRRSLLDGLVFSADRQEIFIAGQRWDLTRGEPIPLMADGDFRFEQTNSYRVVLTPDGRHAASFLSDHSILFWDPAKARAIQKILPAQRKNRSEWSAFAFTPDGKSAVAGKWFPVRRDEDDTPAEPTLRLWDIPAGKEVRSMRPSLAPVLRVMLSPDGETLAVIAFPSTLELWHLPTGRLLRTMQLADVEELPRTFARAAAAFAPHGQWLAFTHREGEIVLLETCTGKEILTLHGHHGLVSSLAFSPDSRRLLSGGRDTTALLWSIIPERPEIPPSWKDSEQLWRELGGTPEQAYRVIWALSVQPARAVEVLAKRLQPDKGTDEKEIRELIQNLSSARFAQRDQAMRRLKEIGTRSLPQLEQSLKKAPDLETSRRIQVLLKTVETALTPETLRDLRGLQILELAGTPAARALLADIARGDRAAAKTRLAQAALDRLSH